MELHCIPLLLFEFMIVRLVAEGNALTLKLLQPFTVNVDATDC